MEFFNTRIHQWYSLNQRNLPWRSSRNPYHIWLSEIILQQTRIDQGLAYYLKFIEVFPTLSDLAAASEDRVLKLWQGLGYYSRARNLHHTAKYICKNYSGKFPDDYHAILKLKGIGPYTAAAIASIAFDQEQAVVDGNVYRLLSRFFGIGQPIDSTSGKKTFRELAQQLIRGTNPGLHNQALMEFGALQCVPQNPDCPSCPLSEKCMAFRTNKISLLPAKLHKQKTRNRYFTYFCFTGPNHTWLSKRNGNDIWKNLYEFPLVETQNTEESDELLLHLPWIAERYKGSTLLTETGNWEIHILSHRRIHYRIVRLNVWDDFELPPQFLKVNKEDIFNFAVPKPIAVYLDKL
jgi:A/G-specific adenine glycosylase